MQTNAISLLTQTILKVEIIFVKDSYREKLLEVEFTLSKIIN